MRSRRAISTTSCATRPCGRTGRAGCLPRFGRLVVCDGRGALRRRRLHGDVMDAPVLDYLRKYNFKKIQLVNDSATGLRAVIAIHSTALGPATGGLRMWTYESEQAAILDALRLARGMTYKYAAAGVNLGGGKAVIIGDPETEKTEALLRAMGRFIDQLAVDYIANSGGTIYDTDRRRKGGFQPERALAKVRDIYARTHEVFAIAERDGIPCYQAADRLAEARIAALTAVKLLG